MNLSAVSNTKSYPISRQLMRDQLADRLEQIDWGVIGTLTFRDDVNEKTARSILRSFWHRIDCKFFKNAVNRHNRRVVRINFVEGGEFKRYHVHFLAKPPGNMSPEKYALFLQEWWKKAPHAGFQNEFIEKGHPRFNSRGWVLYSSKTFSACGTDAWDTASSHLVEPERGVGERS